VCPLQRSQLLPSAAPSSNQTPDTGSIGRRYRPIPKCGLDTSPKSGAYPIPHAFKAELSPIPSSNCRALLLLERILGKACEAGMPGAEFTINWPVSWGTKDITSRVRINRNEERSAWNQPLFEAKRQRLYGMHGVAGRLVVSSSPVRGMRAHRMLRQFSEPTRIQACSGHGASDHCQLRAG